MWTPVRTSVGLLVLSALPAMAATYTVAGAHPQAADTNRGTAEAPWKTLARAGKAPELKPGDTVLIRAGVYREHCDITVSGEPQRPITFAAAPGERVVIKGSEVVRGKWTRVADPNDKAASLSDRRTWKIRLGDAYFTDPRFEGAYRDQSRRWVSQLFWDDDHPLQMIGPDAIYKNEQYYSMVHIGKGRADLIPQSYYFDAADQTLYANLGGDPGWYCIEVGVRGFALTVNKAHDVIVRGIEARHNRQPGGQWPLASIGSCERVTIEDCRFHWGDFTGFSAWGSKQCVIRRCDISNNGAIGLAMGQCEDLTIEDCTLLFNNYRHFYGDWGVAGGMKCIPGNRRITVRRCEAAYNNEAEGIWFDTDNEDIRIVDNVCHHNGDCGVFFEINKAGGVIAGNLIYANNGRGIYVSGSQNTWVVHNTLADNASGIVAMTRAADEPPKHVRILNNLLLRNYIIGEDTLRGSDLTLEQPAEAAKRAELGSSSDYNVFAANTWTPFVRHNWNDNNTLPQWQQRTGQDQHSRLMTVEFERFGTGFRLLTRDGLEVAGPLPEAVTRVWQSPAPKRVGSARTQWP